MSRVNIIKSVVAVLCVSSFLAGCSEHLMQSEYLDRRDMIALHAGDAIAANKAIQTIDPWPAHAANRNPGVNGERIGLGIMRYKENKSIPPQGIATSSVKTPSNGAPPPAAPAQ